MVKKNNNTRTNLRFALFTIHLSPSFHPNFQQEPNMPTPPNKRFALGKGLESLLPARPAPAAAAPAVIPAIAAEAAPSGKPLEIALDLIDRNPFQTRTTFDEAKLDELAASVRASGVVQPIVVRLGTGENEGRYTLITGERRLLASKKAGKATIPAIVREVSNVQAMEMTIVENLQRADLNPIEQAHAYSRLSRDFHMTQEQMAERTGKDRASIANFLRLLRLPESVQKHVESGELSFGHARALLGLPTPEAIAAAAQKVLALHLSVRATENYITGLLNPEAKPKPTKPSQTADPNVREAEDQLRRKLGLKVTIDDKNGRGKVIIEYSGIADFDAILTALGD
jgi:ParB family chromosome partitioning protein